MSLLIEVDSQNTLRIAKPNNLCGTNDMTDPTHEITELLKAWNDGDRDALDKLVPLVDKELKILAHNYMRKERPEHLLQTTALVNEAILRLIREKISWDNRRQFYAIVARRMRQILIDYARRRPKAEYADLNEQIKAEERSAEIKRLHKALEELEATDKRMASIVEYRFFIGLPLAEIANLLGVGQSTVERDWLFARSWLKQEMTGESSKP